MTTIHCLQTIATICIVTCFLILVIGGPNRVCQADNTHQNGSNSKNSQQQQLTTNHNVPNICSTKCTCTDFGINNKKKVDCSHTRITELPLNSVLPPNTANLDVRKNNITKLSQLEQNDDLNYLDLSINGLEKLDNIAFENTKNLIFIDLSFNELTEIPEAIFDNLDELEFLNLSYNKIEVLPKNVFKKCEYLNELRLSHNPLRFIDADLFNTLHQLRSLDLSHNEILSLNSGAFHAMVGLSHLDLSQNYFHAVPTNALQVIRNLESLDLSENPIKVLNEASFLGLSSLKEIRMNKMGSLFEINKKTFTPLYNLIKLSVADNPHLVYIDKYAFFGMFNHSSIKIKDVSFRRNRLTTLSEKTLPFCNLTSLDLQENPWNCNCHLYWVKYCHGKPEFEKGIICATPDKLRGHELELIPFSSLVCEHSGLHQSSLLLTMSLLFMVMMFATLIVFVYRDRIANYYSDKRKQGPIYYVRAKTDNDITI